MVQLDVVPVAISRGDQIGMHPLAGATAIEKILG
jgi:hypothetical protein